MDVSTNAPAPATAPEDEFDKAMSAGAKPAANMTPVRPEIQSPADNEDHSIGDYALDAVKGVARGAENAVAGVRKTARGIADATGLSDLVGDRETNAEPLTHGTAEPETVAGKITSSLAEAGLSWVAGGAVLKGAGIAVKGTSVIGAASQTAVGAALTSDPAHERLSNTLMEYPWLQPAAKLLASDPSDPFVIAKTKAVLEETMTAAAAQGVFNGMHLLFLKMKGAKPAEIAKAEQAVIAGPEAAKPAEVSVGAQPSASGKIAGPDELAKLNAVDPQIQAAKDATQAVIGDKYGDTGAAFRAMKPEEMKAILKTGKMQPGDNPEGISAQLIGKKSTAIYHEGDGMIVRNGEHAPSGRFGEVHVNEASDPTKSTFMIGGKEHTFDEAKAALAPSKPITLTTPTGDPVVTLSPAKQKQFENTMNKLVIKDAVQGITKPTAGVGESAAKQGAPLRQEYNTSGAPILQSLIELGKLTKVELSKSTPAYRSIDETKSLAEIMGQDHASLIANLKASNASLENIDAIATGARQYLQTKGMEMWQTARKVTLSGDPEAHADFAAQYTHLSEFQAEFSQLTTRLGRGLRSFGAEVGPFDSSKLKKVLTNPEEAKNLQQLIAATDGNVDQIAHILKMQQMSFLQKAVGTHNEYWTGLGLLSRMATQVVNVGSTAFNSIIADPTAMLVGGGMRGVAGQGWTEAREAIGIYSGFRTAFNDSMQMAWKAAKTEQAILSQNGTMEQKTQFISALTYNMNPDTYLGKFIDLMGNGVRLSFRGLTAGDEFFKQLSYRAKISATAGREAADMVRAKTLHPDAVPQYIQDALQKAIDGKGAATNETALKYAEKATFVNDLKGETWGDWASMGEQMARLSSHPILRGTILPFVKTPTNVTRTTFEYTPLVGQLRKQFWADIQAGGEKQALAIGKLTLGSGMYIGAMHLALDERITGAPPAPGVVMPAGWKPYSMRFRGMGDNGGDLYLSYQRLQPFGDILGLTADFAKTTGMIDENKRDGLASAMTLALTKAFTMGEDGAATAVAAAYGKSLISKTYYRNLTEFFSTFSGYNNESAMLRWFQNYSASHVPGALSMFNNDETVREVRSTMDAIMARIPGLSQQLPPRRDLFGDVHDIKAGGMWNIINPLAASKTKGDPVMDELTRLSNDPNVKMTIPEPEHFATVGGQRVDLKLVKNASGQTAYDRMTELMQSVKAPGETKNLHGKLHDVMHDPRYQLGKDNPVLDANSNYTGVRESMIHDAIAKYRLAAKDKMMDEYASELGIKNAMQSHVDEQVARQKIKAGIGDKLLQLAR